MSKIKELVDNFRSNIEHYQSVRYNETQVRNEFLDPLFELLDWDIRNSKGQKTSEREVLVEESLRNDSLESIKKPDYTFRLFAERKFFLEAKKPYVKIQNDKKVAFQTKRYGWSANLKISIASNFEYLLIYDCSIKPSESDNVNKGLIAKYHYLEFEEKLEEIKSLLGHSVVYSGEFDKYWERIDDPITKVKVDDQFLKDINRWRILLANQVYKADSEISLTDLNDQVQGYLNALVFLRVCEDRNIEEYKSLSNSIDETNIDKLIEKFRDADKKFNSGLFELEINSKIIENVNSAFWDIVKELYYPNTIYSFGVMSSDILGNIYEIYLAEKLVKKDASIVLAKKVDHLDRDVVTTPTYIVREIIRKTLDKKLLIWDGKDLPKIKIADIACGSGAFLLEAFQHIHDYLVDYYLEHDKTQIIEYGINSYKLPFSVKKEILINNIHGIDKDYNAVQAAKLGLLLKILEGENQESLGRQSQILPYLKRNISWGNTLISPNDLENFDEAINPYEITSKFDVIVGNPPYMKTEDMKNLLSGELDIYKNKYQTAFKQFDKYYLFIERGFELLEDDGVLGYIVPSKFTKIGSGEKLREYIADKHILSEYVSFGANQVFSNRTTYTCILILQGNNTDTSFNYYEVHDINKWKARSVNSQDSNEILHNTIDQSNWILLSKESQKIYRKIWENSKTLEVIVESDNIFNGIQTSANDVYVIDKWDDEDNYITFERDRKSYKIEKELVRPFFIPRNSNDNLNTYKYIHPNKLVIYPYELKDNRSEFINIEKLKNDYPYAFEYLSDFKERLSSRDIKPTPETDSEWYRYGRHQSLNKFTDEEKIIVGILSNGDKYSVDRNKTFIASGGTAGYCAIRLPNGSQYSIYYIQAMLNSKYTEWVAMQVGDIFRGGYFAHGTSVLKKLPIRQIDFNSDDKILHDRISITQKELLDIGTQLNLPAISRRDKELKESEFDSLLINQEENIRELLNITSAEDSKVPLIKDYNETD